MCAQATKELVQPALLLRKKQLPYLPWVQVNYTTDLARGPDQYSFVNYFLSENNFYLTDSEDFFRGVVGSFFLQKNTTESSFKNIPISSRSQIFQHE